ncbi:MAG: SpoIID/LytB domain-containing protein [Candidatus Omnitrophica bacterium]|nr:SpoIID/LytB domain-containing protein [Candidatus Omnitrophota bacterium]
MKKLFYIPVAIAIFSLTMPGTALSAEQERDIVLRVSISDDRDNVNLALKGRYKMYPINSDAVVMEGPYLAANVTATKDGIKIGKGQIALAAVKVKVAKDSNIYVDSRRFRGDIDIIRKDNGRIMVVNYIGLEDYLYGVLYHEVSHRWPAEVLKAQAIAARTFALYQARQNKSQPYDLRSDIYSQVYGGRTSEKWSTTRAVDLTKGEVLTYNGDIVPAYYHATCAGYTEDASALWNMDVPYLKGVQCGYCKNSKHYKWRKEISLWELADKLKDGGYKIGKIASVTVLSKNRSDRVDKIEIKDDAGISVILTGKDFRQIIGPNEVRSTKFDASIKWNLLILEGLGWGHGVGMCQWGAYGMARKGMKAEEILKYYYPGTEISTIDKVKL